MRELLGAIIFIVMAICLYNQYDSIMELRKSVDASTQKCAQMQQELDNVRQALVAGNILKSGASGGSVSVFAPVAKPTPSWMWEEHGPFSEKPHK